MSLASLALSKFLVTISKIWRIKGERGGEYLTKNEFWMCSKTFLQIFLQHANKRASWRTFTKVLGKASLLVSDFNQPDFFSKTWNTKFYENPSTWNQDPLRKRIGTTKPKIAPKNRCHMPVYNLLERHKNLRSSHFIYLRVSYNPHTTKGLFRDLSFS